MDVSAAVVLGLVVLTCAVGAAYGARWVSRRSDEQMERTRAALRARHAVPEQPAPLQRVADPQPSRGEPATRQLPRDEPAAVRLSDDAPSSVPAAAVPAAAVPQSRGEAATVDGPAAGARDDDPESSGRHRVREELMRAVTYTLSPDRVARAKVPGPRPRCNPDKLNDRRS